MATIEFFTGFEGCENTTDARILFDDTNGPVDFSSSNGFDGSNSIRLESEDDYRHHAWIKKNCVSAKTKVIGFHVKNVGKANYNTTIEYHLLRLTIGDSYLRLFNTSDGLEVYRDDTLIASCEDSITTSIYHVEAKFYSDASSGAVAINLNGYEVLNETGLNTGGDDITEIHFGGCNKNDVYFDNIFIADDWIGELKTKLLQPISDDSVQFTPSDGSDNYAMLQNNDGDDNYVYSDTVDHKDLYGYGPDVADDQYVKGVFVQTVARKDDTNARSLQTVMEAESTEYDLDEYALSNEYPTTKEEVQFQVLGKAPDDTDWTYEKVNGMKVGFKVSA